ncbi:MAG: hypothetical protein KKA73_13430 [Chloroflexi bacterium]|nr:hypothetical protein [Chloroflexota bacterium]MBU1748683.1 hypothetical protein [Chloroflexota bacterium]
MTGSTREWTIEERADAVRAAVFLMLGDPDGAIWPYEVYDDYVIIRDARGGGPSRYYKARYTITDDMVVTVEAEWEPVEKAWLPLTPETTL